MPGGFRFDITAGAALLYPLLYFFDESGWFAALLPGMILHELGHWIAVKASGGKVTALRLDIAGLCMNLVGVSRRERLAFCAAAGPAAGLLWTAAASHIPSSWAQKSAAAALLVNLFNLLPAFPLDGGRILEGLTGSRRAVRYTSAAVIITLLFFTMHFRITGLLIPAGLLLGELLSS